VVSSLGCAAPTSVKKRDFVQQHGVLSSFDDLKNCGYDEELIALIQSFSELDAGFDQSLAAGVAVKISSGLEELEPIDPTRLEDYESFKRNVERFNRVSDIIKENTGKDFGKITISRGKYDEIMSTAVKYAPLVNSYNELIESSKNLDPEDEDSVRRFYIALFLVGVDIALINSGAIYKGTYKSVWEINQALGLREVVPFIGYKGYGFLLSSIHWTLRGYIEGFKNDVYEVLLDETTQDLKRGLKNKGKDISATIEKTLQRLLRR